MNKVYQVFETDESKSMHNLMNEYAEDGYTVIEVIYRPNHTRPFVVVMEKEI